jgi:hypothetical protein
MGVFKEHYNAILLIVLLLVVISGSHSSEYCWYHVDINHHVFLRIKKERNLPTINVTIKYIILSLLIDFLIHINNL